MIDRDYLLIKQGYRFLIVACVVDFLMQRRMGAQQ